MVLNISNHESTVIERGVYYFGLSNYPNITAIELSKIKAFLNYEKSYGRKTEIICEDEIILSVVSDAAARLDTMRDILLPAENEFVYHATDVKAARKILFEGKLLSATEAYGKTGKELAYEKRDSPWNDPADFFEYIMFCWGDDTTGDYVVLSEGFPSEEDLKRGNFNPGVRFYFRYEDLKQHPGHAFDGYHPIKVKNEITLTEYLHSCIVPEQYKNELEGKISSKLVKKVHYLDQLGLGISNWSEKVCDFVAAALCP